jgi:hypothetical protein
MGSVFSFSTFGSSPVGSVEFLIRANRCDFAALESDPVELECSAPGVIDVLAAEQNESDVMAIARVQQWLDGLRPSQRQVFDLLYRQELSQREAADGLLPIFPPFISRVRRLFRPSWGVV